jgi:hypothetical protein
MSLLKISPYISWKGTSTNSVTPSNSRPDLNAAGPAFKAQPINHWRKQLIPTSDSGSRNRRAGVGMPMDTPGGSVYLGNVSTNTSCLLNASETAVGLKENIEKYDNINCSPNSADCFYDISNNRMARITGPRRIRPSTTILDKQYYSDRKGYLHSRCFLYDQKLYTIIDDTLDSEYSRRTQNCPAQCPTTNSCQTIYKPNNEQYSQQGAVDSSSRITRLKLNTINKNAASYKNVFGTTAPRYNGSSSTPYFLKSKYQVCVPLSLTGDKTVCPV